MKNSIPLFAALLVNWLLWSGHFDNPFLIALGLASCLFCLWLSARMSIVDEEGAPAQLGIRPFLFYAPWLAKEVLISSLEVSKIILSPSMPLRRNLVSVSAKQKSPIGRVIFANSMTLTPGTVSVRLQDNEVLVHALSLKESAEQMSAEMGQRVCQLERDQALSGRGVGPDAGSDSQPTSTARAPS